MDQSPWHHAPAIPSHCRQVEKKNKKLQKSPKVAFDELVACVRIRICNLVRAV